MLMAVEAQSFHLHILGYHRSEKGLRRGMCFALTVSATTSESPSSLWGRYQGVEERSARAANSRIQSCNSKLSNCLEYSSVT